ncbi:hypothetical protein BDB01DRAFT_834769 [Pilobolus umbonatus]|nr:hypothetical protein BDB01DRAFT_834769 [Pilobolus umbonatus]
MTDMKMNEMASSPLLNNNDMDMNTTAFDHPWVMCSGYDTETSIERLGYDCRDRPYTTVLLIISILLLFVLRKTSLVEDRGKRQNENLVDEEEGLMDRVKQ